MDNYHKKREDIINKFTTIASKELYQYDPMFHTIIETLIRDGNPYDIIGDLILERKKLLDELQIFHMNEKLSPKFITRELYDKWHDEAIKEKRNENPNNLNFNN